MYFYFLKPPFTSLPTPVIIPSGPLQPTPVIISEFNYPTKTKSKTTSTPKVKLHSGTPKASEVKKPRLSRTRISDVKIVIIQLFTSYLLFFYDKGLGWFQLLICEYLGRLLCGSVGEGRWGVGLWETKEPTKQ